METGTDYWRSRAADQASRPTPPPSTGALRHGGVYFAAMGVHTASPMMVQWHAANRDELHLPPLHDVDDVVATFRRAGFDAAVGRLPVTLVPVTSHGPHHQDRVLDWLTYYRDHKLLLRFARPAS